MDMEKTLPQAPDIERAVLAMLMLDEESQDFAFGEYSLKENHFYKPTHRLIFNAIKALYNADKEIDQLTVIEKLKDGGHVDTVGGAEAIAGLAGEMLSGALIRSYCAILKEKYTRRGLITIAKELESAGYTAAGDISRLAANHTLKIENLITDKSRGVRNIADALSEAHMNISERANSVTGLTGVPTGLPRYDYNTGGWQKGDLVILAARPGMGKTTLAMNCALHAVSHDYPVGMLSLEMSDVKLAERMIASEARVAISEIHYNKPTDDQWKDMARFGERAADYPIYIDDTSGVNIAEITSKARKMHRDHGIKVLIIDYLQLGRGSGEQSRRLEIEGISSGLKTLAKSLDITVIALSQLRRLGSDEKPRVPGLSDLKESGSLEADSDIVLFIYDPPMDKKVDYFSKKNVSVPANEILDKIRVLDIQKHRQGPPFTLMLRFDGRFFRFNEMDAFN